MNPTEMDGQFNLFEQLEEAERDAKNKRAVREGYRIWLKTPDLTPCEPNPVIDYRIHNGIIHICETMPKDVYMWCNPTIPRNGGEFWILQKPKKVGYQPKQLDICPYCKVNLNKGEGQRYLRKSTGDVYTEKSYRAYYGLDEIDADPGSPQCESG